MLSEFQSLTISEKKFLLRCLTVFWMRFLILLWWCFTINIIIHFHFILFVIFIICLFYNTCFNCFKWDIACYHLASLLMLGQFTYFGQFLYFINFLFHPFIRRCLVQSSLYTYFKVRFMLLLYAVTRFEWFNAIFCFNHYFNGISIVTVFKQYFYGIFSSPFMIILLLDFTLRMASSKWKPNMQILKQKVLICHPLCRNLVMWKLLVILVVVKLYAQIDTFKL